MTNLHHMMLYNTAGSEEQLYTSSTTLFVSCKCSFLVVATFLNSFFFNGWGCIPPESVELFLPSLF